ncbi:uncharacterized protein SETTUDRAFT_168065 [Exserohilum turcica Et28A]|uniref:Uncharacterized protein n=1 Tax=Exserohilum turcicum (strain 28A) TaxID=671987 RepID=R0KHW1_EXST2|nr:uncharacterized protein SETTUDRAFT_168065 [Exserohilum turcica Et28A]EOA88819.1 hypothetical protein SETTUDRAFT_168065 [Exserohilum turcica Et28A]
MLRLHGSDTLLVIRSDKAGDYAFSTGAVASRASATKAETLLLGGGFFVETQHTGARQFPSLPNISSLTRPMKRSRRHSKPLFASARAEKKSLAALCVHANCFSWILVF